MPLTDYTDCTDKKREQVRDEQDEKDFGDFVLETRILGCKDLEDYISRGRRAESGEKKYLSQITLISQIKNYQDKGKEEG